MDLVKGAKSFISISWGTCRHSCKWRPTVATFEIAKTPRINFVRVLNDSFFDKEPYQKLKGTNQLPPQPHLKLPPSQQINKTPPLRQKKKQAKATLLSFTTIQVGNAFQHFLHMSQLGICHDFRHVSTVVVQVRIITSA